jgi:hypothetical protein
VATKPFNHQVPQILIFYGWGPAMGHGDGILVQALLLVCGMFAFEFVIDMSILSRDMGGGGPGVYMILVLAMLLIGATIAGVFFMF